jgi:hypothetical protein
MSRFANRNATKRFVLGPCACPGTPHTEDYMDIRAELSAADLAAMEAVEPIARMRVLVVSWNLIGDDGNVASIDDDYLGRLYLDEFDKLNAWLDANAKVRALPNGSAAPSRASSQESGSPTRKAKTGSSSTTPSWPLDGASATTTSGTSLPSS